jgi:hypothetical protein
MPRFPQRAVWFPILAMEPKMEPAAPKQSNSWDVRGRRRRIALCVFAAIVCPMMSMGCLSLNIGGWSQKADDPSVVAQTGSTAIPKGQEATVYYPKPYASPPNLELDDTFRNYKIIEQKADCFRVRNESGTWDLKWTARGVPVQPAVVVTPSTPPATATVVNH